MQGQNGARRRLRATFAHAQPFHEYYALATPKAQWETAVQGTELGVKPRYRPSPVNPRIVFGGTFVIATPAWLLRP